MRLHGFDSVNHSTSQFEEGQGHGHTTNEIRVILSPASAGVL
jgi:hypothetical protein